MHILIASPRAETELKEFIDGLNQEADIVSKVSTGDDTLKFLKDSKPDLIVIDENLSDYEPFRLITEILKINAMIHTAVMTSLPYDEFHEKSEGLGVLSAVSGDPGDNDAGALIEKLRAMGL